MDIKEFEILFRNKKNHLIGVIGHRDLLESDFRINSKSFESNGLLDGAIADKLNEIKQQTNKEIYLLSPLANGADLLVAKVAKDLKIKIIQVAPWEVNSFNKNQKIENPILETDGLFTICNKPEIYNDVNNSNLLFDNAGKFLLINCDEILFLWDGVYTGNQGGTSESYRQAFDGFSLSRKDKKILKKRSLKKLKVHHLVVPRQSNPFPAGRRFNDEKDNPIKLHEFSKVYPYLWHTDEVKNPLKRKYFNWRNDKSKYYFWRSRYFWAYGIPLTIIILMTVLWVIQYYCYESWGKWNLIYHILELIKMPNADLDNKFISFQIFKQIAISLGVILLPYISIVSIIYILSNDRRIVSARTFRNYSLILGLGWKGAELAHNLIKNKKWINRKVVVIEKDVNNANIKSAIRAGIRVINGNFNDSFIYKRIKWSKASDIYLMAKDDETNIRAIQLIDRLSSTKQFKIDGDKINLHIHVDDFKHKFFVSKALQKNRNVQINCFNIYDNIIRRILLKHPIDRFYFNKIRQISKIPEADTIKVILLGVNEVGLALLRYILTHCIYEVSVEVKIEVYYENEKELNNLEQVLPAAFSKDEQNERVTYFSGVEKGIVDFYTYSNFSIKAYKLPFAEHEVLHEAPYLQDLKSNEVTSIFTCIDDGLRSTAYLSAILPALEAKKKETLTKEGVAQLDIQVYCYFNFPEEKENTFIENSINNLADHIPVFFFGNFTEEFTECAIKGQELDKLAKMVNLLYHIYYEKNQLETLRAVAKLNSSLKKSENKKNINTPKNIILKPFFYFKSHNKIKRKKYEQDLFNKLKSLEFKDRFKVIATLLPDFVYNDPSLEVLDISWNQLDEFKKESNRLAADHLFYKLRFKPDAAFMLEEITNNSSIDGIYGNFFKLDTNLEEIAELEHRRWCAERLFYGWKGLEEIKHLDTELKEAWFNKTWKVNKKRYEAQKQHFDLEAYNQLITSEQRKDYDFIEGMDLVMLGLGFILNKDR